MSNLSNYAGIDVSKKTFDVAIEQDGRFHHHQFMNDEKGFKAFISILPDGYQCVMEATGVYYLRLATFLYEQEIKVSVVNPLVIKRFSQMQLNRAKTDKADAKMICRYAQMQEPGTWKPETAHVLELKQNQAAIENFISIKTSLINQLEAFKHSTIRNSLLEKSIKCMLVKTAKEIKNLEQRMQQIVEENYTEMFNQLKSIPGIGNKTAILLIAITDGFKKFTSAKKLSCYIGINPRIFESGTSIKGKSKISKMGAGRMRALLFMSSMSCLSCNHACKQLYNRLKEKGKNGRLALIAVANKLVKQAFAIATKGEYYNANFSSK